jgi:hypothetical protein
VHKDDPKDGIHAKNDKIEKQNKSRSLSNGIAYVCHRSSVHLNIPVRAK